MKVTLNNLGPLKHASFELSDLTIICGDNNTGKTYATYALFGFLETWHNHVDIDLDETTVQTLLDDGTVHIDLKPYLTKTKEILQLACESYRLTLAKNIFAASPENFINTSFNIEVEQSDLEQAFERKIHTSNTEVFSLCKTEGSHDLTVSLLTHKPIHFSQRMLTLIIASAIKDILFASRLPKPFIASSERTGAAIFRKKINSSHSRLLKEMSQENIEVNPLELLFKSYQDYALPVESNVDFALKLETIVKETSFIANHHPEILHDFANIIGGTYHVNNNDKLSFQPHRKKINLSMDESSSTVRSLLNISFYLHHIAQQGDLLIIDEPELNLHPKNQRHLSRLFARLMNIGIKVFITTHSDYIVKELNTLIMLNHDKKYLREIAQEEGYQKSELIDAKQVKVYIAKEKLILLPNKTRRTRHQTLSEARVDPEMGIDAHSFDSTIDTMNRIQEAIVWGGD
ncbi:MAG: AAA family ATPase [Mariprofundaceae bacterium]|nr:AAA family ATPase [Mariprofundaceae bacterium]